MPAMPEKDLEVIRGIFAAQNDVEAVYALFHPDIEWEDVSGLWLADWGKPRGHEAVRQTFRRWFEVFDEVEFTAEDFTDVGEDTLVTVHVKARARVSEVPVEQRVSMLFTVRDGLIARVRAYRERSAALRAAGADRTARPKPFT
jgi:ketosteroid isomerase-like protein